MKITNHQNKISFTRNTLERNGRVFATDILTGGHRTTEVYFISWLGKRLDTSNRANNLTEHLTGYRSVGRIATLAIDVVFSYTGGVLTRSVLTGSRTRSVTQILVATKFQLRPFLAVKINCLLQISGLTCSEELWKNWRGLDMLWKNWHNSKENIQERSWLVPVPGVARRHYFFPKYSHKNTHRAPLFVVALWIPWGWNVDHII